MGGVDRSERAPAVRIRNRSGSLPGAPVIDRPIDRQLLASRRLMVDGHDARRAEERRRGEDGVRGVEAGPAATLGALLASLVVGAVLVIPSMLAEERYPYPAARRDLRPFGPIDAGIAARSDASCVKGARAARGRTGPTPQVVKE